MKILILTSVANRHLFFASEIMKSFPEDDVYLFQDPKGSGKIKKSKIKRLFTSKYKLILIRNFFYNLIYKIFLLQVSKEKEKTEEEYFGDVDVKSINELNNRKRLFILDGNHNINHAVNNERIKAIEPDVIVVMGTSLIKDEIINIPKLGILNLHTGLSPAYRGGMTNFWPFIYREIGLCGVTVHKLDIGIDSGEIIFHGKPDIESGDTYSSINCKSIIIGTKLMIQAINDISRGNLVSYQQAKGGRLFFNRDYNGYMAYKYIKSYAQTIEEYLKK